jgi:glycosyltransferase involved in cell wall biosynthesis
LKKILLANNYFYRRGGAEVVCLEEMRLLEEIGWQAVPFAMRHPKNLSSPWDPYFVDEIEHGGVYSPWQNVVSAGKVIYSFEAQRNLRRLLSVFRPDVAHVHNIYHHISPSILRVLRAEGIPTVLTLHDLKLACPAYKMFTHDGVCERCKGQRLFEVIVHKCVKESRALSALIALESAVHRAIGAYSRNVDRFVVPSKFYLSKLCEWGWKEAAFSYLPNFVDLDVFTVQRGVGKHFVFFGRLGPEKGLATLIRAAAAAGVPVWIVGTGPEEPSLRKLTEEVGADVEFMGYRAGKELREVIGAARAMVLPSEWYENAPMSVMEAYAMGKPVIGAGIGGIPELIAHDETGAVFDSGSVESLARALSTFAAMNDARVAEMGMAGRNWMEKDFSAARHRDRLIQLYGDLGVL